MASPAAAPAVAGAGTTTRAVFACSPTRRRMAADVCPLARASSQRPSKIRPMMITAES